MDGSIIINVLVYKHDSGSLETSSIGLKPDIGDLPKNVFGVYTPSGGSSKSLPGGLHNFC